MADNYAPVHLATGRLVYLMPTTIRKKVIKTALEITEPDYLVINDPLKYPYILPHEVERFAVMREAFPGRFEVAHTYKGGKIYRFSGAGKETTSGS